MNKSGIEIIDPYYLDLRVYRQSMGNNWGLAGGGSYTGEALQADNTYLIAVGPGILIPDYQDQGRLMKMDFDFETGITLVLQEKESGESQTINCEVKDVKAHTYNRYPDGHENDTLPYEVIAGMQNGLVQTGVSYPKSSNAGKSGAFAPGNTDGSVIEFAGETVDLEIENYYLKKIIVETKE